MRWPSTGTGLGRGDKRRVAALLTLAIAFALSANAGSVCAVQSGATPRPVKASATLPPLDDHGLDVIEQVALSQINEERRAIGVQDLVVSPELCKIARQYCRDMAERRFFAHLDPDGKMVYDRAAKGGVSEWTNIAENIARNRGFEDPAVVAVREWMKSAGHRDNILNARFVETGLGAWVGPDRTVYFAQIFIRRPPKR
ncbi:MAG: CAP domain-containing protein [Blastocatellia bacterium]|nr:CAP domain-containing protein [Blastocatellia bacterium]